MSFVVYDVETTGLNKRFDQIVQFAAVLTDTDLNIKDRAATSCRLMPHVIPSPKAMQVTGLQIEELDDASRPSHYEMVAEIRGILESWSPTLFLGFNSLSFDEELLRQAFYLCLYNPYLTNTQRNARADVLNLCRMTASLRPDVISPATDENGCEVFRLKPLAEANGIPVPVAHSAMADVSTTLALCRKVKERAPGIWSQFLRFSQKATVESFIVNEDAFVVSETLGNRHRARVVTRIGRNTELRTRHYCLDVNANLDMLRGMPDAQLVNLCRGPTRPIVTIRTNTAPTLWALYEATQEQLAPFRDEVEILRIVGRVREDADFLQRLRNVAQSAEPDYPPSPHLEDQIYGYPFASRHDEELMHQFHATRWEERPSLIGKFRDSRYRRLALRLIYFERPHLLNLERKRAIEAAIRSRLISASDAETPWRSIPEAKQDLDGIFASSIERDERLRQLRYLDYLNKRTESLTRDLP